MAESEGFYKERHTLEFPVFDTILVVNTIFLWLFLCPVSGAALQTKTENTK